jgi:hypothetical protein
MDLQSVRSVKVLIQLQNALTNKSISCYNVHIAAGGLFADITPFVWTAAIN